MKIAVHPAVAQLKWLTALALILLTAASAEAQCPSRSSSTLDIDDIIDVPVTAEKRLSGNTYLVVFDLLSDHAFDPIGCQTASPVVTADSSINVSSVSILVANPNQTVVELTPQDDRVSVKYCFRVNFEEDYNLTSTLKPRKKKQALILPALDSLDPGEVFTVSPESCGTDD